MKIYDIANMLFILDKYDISSWEELDEKLSNINKREILNKLKQQLH